MSKNMERFENKNKENDTNGYLWKVSIKKLNALYRKIYTLYYESSEKWKLPFLKFVARQSYSNTNLVYQK